MQLTVTLLGAVAVTAGAASADTLPARTMHTDRLPNRLITTTSPYLLSHAYNPVDWYPWGTEALEKAKREAKPVFLSIGYAACHWCHVMERESFENDSIAALLNRHFISIKVDREERPDLDHIYMTFTQAMSGSGGWPMSVFLTPDLKPFFAGTYFPPDDRYGRPGFAHVLTQLAEAWQAQRSEVVGSSEEIFRQVRDALLDGSGSQAIMVRDLFARGAAQLLGTVDQQYGGIGSAPKFPHPIELRLFLIQYQHSNDLRYLRAVEQALQAMARGGIYDHLGGGFARYSVDRQWQVPHFEKMLYDNALLVSTYADCWRLTRNELYRIVARETLDWMLREMQLPSGGFASAIDADSDGEEGKFYVWSNEEFRAVCGADADLMADYFSVTPEGNFEGETILHLSSRSDEIARSTPQFEQVRARAVSALLAKRAQRNRPLTDDKLLCSWNGLAIAALADGYLLTGESRFLDQAASAAEFIRTRLWNGNELIHCWREGKGSTGQFLEDYAYLLHGLLALAEADARHAMKWISFAQELADRGAALFLGSDGSVFLREDNQSDLIVRPREETDSALPAPGSLFIHALLRLERLTGETRFQTPGERALRQLSGRIEKYPSAMASALLAMDYWLGDKIEIAATGDSEERPAMLRLIGEHFLASRVVAISLSGHDDLPLFSNRTPESGVCTVYICRNSVCRLPITTAQELSEYLTNF